MRLLADLEDVAPKILLHSEELSGHGLVDNWFGSLLYLGLGLALICLADDIFGELHSLVFKLNLNYYTTENSNVREWW